jgi:hypothetical protein
MIAALLFTGCSSSPEPVTPEKNSTDLSDTYTAEVPYPDFRSVPGETIKAYAGPWTIVLDEQGDLYSISSKGYGRVSGTIARSGDRLVFDDPPAPEGAFNCFVDGERTLTEGAGSYTYSVDGDQLSLTVENDPCPLRAAILDRSWSRVGN